MTIPNTFTNGTLANATEVNSNFNYMNTVWDLEGGDHGNSWTGVIAHSTTNYSFVDSLGRVYLWNGTTLTSKEATGPGPSVIYLCKADATHGVTVETLATGQVKFTDDSGATWTIKTSVGHSADVYDASFPTATLIVVGGSDAGADHIQFSTDDGASWVDATTSPGAAVHAVDMFDGTTGYAVDSSSNIWKTTDSAVTWVDTTDNITSSASTGSMLCLTADIVLFSSNGTLQYYVNSTNTITKKLGYGTDNSGFVNTDGNIYTLMWNSSFRTAVLAASPDLGVTWNLTPSSVQIGSADGYKCNLAAYDTGKIMTTDSTMLKKLDRSNL